MPRCEPHASHSKKVRGAISPHPRRGRIIWKLGDLILENLEQLAELESLDNGKPLTVARAADVPLAADLFHYMAGWTTKLEGNTIPLSVPYARGTKFLAYTRRDPIGVVGQVIPGTSLCSWPPGNSALLCATGNTIVLKPAEQTPLSAIRLAELALEAGLPEGVLNVVTGFGETAGAALAAHDDVDKIAFTGSTEVGKIIVRAAAGNLKKVTLGTRRQITHRRLQGRRGRGRRHSGRRQRHLFQSRPVLLRRIAALRRRKTSSSAWSKVSPSGLRTSNSARASILRRKWAPWSPRSR